MTDIRQNDKDIWKKANIFVKKTDISQNDRHLAKSQIHLAERQIHLEKGKYIWKNDNHLAK
jgi:hypothetical protein